MNPDLIYLFVGEIVIILALYRFLLRDWVIDKWEEKIEEEGWLVVKLDPVINEIEDRMHDKLQEFQSSFFGSLGAASRKLDDATGATTIKALTRDNPMMGFVAEYMMKRGNLGGLVSQNNPNSVDSTAPESGKLGLKK